MKISNNKQQGMYFADSSMLEKTLHNDLNTVIRSIKTRQEQHLRLLDYNRAIAIKQRDIQDTIFINDELTRHRNFQAKLQNEDRQLVTQEREIIGKYQFISPTIYNETIFKLMSRVGARILELFESSTDIFKTYSEELQEKHKTMKSSCLKALNQKEKIDISELLGVVLTYIHDKVAEELIKLSRMIEVLEAGEIQQLNFIYERQDQRKNNLKKKESAGDISLDMKREKQKIKDKISKLKEEAKNKEITKKQKSKVAQRMVTALSSVMDIHKNQFMEDVVCTNPQEKYKKLYDEIYIRNRFNREQIIAFEAKTENFHEKVRRFKQMMLMESAKIQQAVIIKSSPKIPVKQETSENQPIVFSDRQIPFAEVVLPEVEVLACKFTEQRPFRTTIQKSQSPRIVKETTQFYSMQSTQQASHHLRFDSKQEEIYLRTNRAKLPQIGRISAEQSGQTFKKSAAKQSKKLNIVSNININGDEQRPKKVESFSLKKQKVNLSLNKQQQSKNSIPKSLQYTFYIKKRATKFYETKNNFVM